MLKNSITYGAFRPTWDRGDCSIRALAVATSVPYEIASMVFSVKGRRLKSGTSLELSVEVHEKILGMRPVTMAEGMLLENFVYWAFAGNYIVHKAGHAFAVINGVVHDWEKTTNPRTKIRRAWKVTQKAYDKMANLSRVIGGIV